jgi:hypothetical protein
MEAFFVIAVVLLINAAFWIWQFLDLMMMPDEDFPGRFDKALWVVVFLMFFVFVAPIAFGLWKEKNRERLRKLRPRTPDDQRITPG